MCSRLRHRPLPLRPAVTSGWRNSGALIGSSIRTGGEAEPTPLNMDYSGNRQRVGRGGGVWEGCQVSELLQHQPHQENEDEPPRAPASAPPTKTEDRRVCSRRGAGCSCSEVCADRCGLMMHTPDVDGSHVGHAVDADERERRYFFCSVYILVTAERSNFDLF